MHLTLVAILTAALLLVPAGMAHAVWPHDPNVNVQVSSTVSASPAVLPDGSGGTFIAWQDNRGAGFQIYVQHVLASGVVNPAWPVDGRAVCTAPNAQGTPVMISDGAGGAILVWWDRRNGMGNDIYAHHLLAGGVLDPAWPVDGRAVCTAGGDQYDHSVVSDGAGGAVVAWMDFRSGVGADIYAQRILISGVVDPSWPVNGQALCTAVDEQWHPSAVSDAAGGVIVAWQDARGGEGFLDIYAARVFPTGGIDDSWPADGRVVCDASGNQESPRCVTDGATGAIVAWTDLRSGVHKIYAQHVYTTGLIDPVWPANGRVVADTAGTQWEHAAAPDGAGGVILAWSDGRKGTEYDLYAHHLTNLGTIDPTWPALGRAVCTASDNQTWPQIVSDGANGALLAWSDARGFGGTGLYAHHLLPTGALDSNWPVQGRAVSTAPGGHVLGQIVLDPPGSAILAWGDNRFGASRVHAQRVDRWGALGGVEPQIVSVKDVPNDQGGRVKLSWNGSYLDALGVPDVASYDILRSVPASLAMSELASGARRLHAPDDDAPAEVGDLLSDPNGVDGYYWELVTSTPALHYIINYSYVASTFGDSLDGSNPETVFMVVARNAGNTMHWLSAPDSGYSVDDLAPAAPNAVVGQYTVGATHLHWAPNPEADFAHYRIYRGSDETFLPGPGNLIASPPDTGYSDVVVGAYVYKLTAVDVHGNESPAASVVPAGTVAVGDLPRVASFLAPSPNPAFAATTLRFALPVAGRARLAIYDAAGRLVRTVSDGPRDAGEYVERWDLRDATGNAVRAGLYFARFECAGATFARRIVVVR